MYTELKCKNCTAPLKIDIARKTAVCPYCKSEYAAEDIVNHYITNNVVTNTTNIANMHADVVTILDESSSEQRLNAADQWMLFNEWGKALSIYAEVCETTPQNYRGWNGRALAESNLLASSLPGEISVLDDLFNRVSDYIKKAMSTAPLQEKTVVEHTKTAFAHNMKASVLEIRKRVLNKLSHVEDAEDSTSSVNGLLKRINTLDNNLEVEKNELEREENLLAYLENESSRADKRMYGLRHPGRLGAIIGAILILCIDYLLWKTVAGPVHEYAISFAIPAVILGAVFFGLISRIFAGFSRVLRRAKAAKLHKRMSAQTEYVAEKRRLIENLEAELEHMNELKASAEAEDARLHQVLDHISASEMKIDQLMNN